MAIFPDASSIDGYFIVCSDFFRLIATRREEVDFVHVMEPYTILSGTYRKEITAIFR